MMNLSTPQMCHSDLVMTLNQSCISHMSMIVTLMHLISSMNIALKSQIYGYYHNSYKHDRFTSLNELKPKERISTELTIMHNPYSHRHSYVLPLLSFQCKQVAHFINVLRSQLEFDENFRLKFPIILPFPHAMTTQWCAVLFIGSLAKIRVTAKWILHRYWFATE